MQIDNAIVTQEKHKKVSEEALRERHRLERELAVLEKTVRDVQVSKEKLAQDAQAKDASISQLRIQIHGLETKVDASKQTQDQIASKVK